MAEFTAAVAQEVAANQDVLFTETAVNGNCSILHREGSGLVTLRGLTNGQCRALYQVAYSGNIAIPTGGTVGEISLAIAIDGEALSTGTGRVTPAAVEEYGNVSMISQVTVFKGCCVECSVQNTSGQAIEVANSNIIVSRIA